MNLANDTPTDSKALARGHFGSVKRSLPSSRTSALHVDQAGGCGARKPEERSGRVVIRSTAFIGWLHSAAPPVGRANSAARGPGTSPVSQTFQSYSNSFRCLFVEDDRISANSRGLTRAQAVAVSASQQPWHCGTWSNLESSFLGCMNE